MPDTAPEPGIGCAKPSAGPIVSPPSNGADAPAPTKEVPKVLAKVGKEAIDFEATAYQDGVFKNVKLSDYKGKWVVLCFYPGDFTFV